MNIKYFILLLLVALVSACNEEGIATLVIEGRTTQRSKNDCRTMETQPCRKSR